MRNTDEPFRHERRGLQFLLALRRGDAAELAGLWEEAEGDPVLAGLFEELLEEAEATQDSRRTTDGETQTGQECPATQPGPAVDRGRLALPPLPAVIVHHPSPSGDEDLTRPATPGSKEHSFHAGFIEKAR
jgi:hypothetical protein